MSRAAEPRPTAALSCRGLLADRGPGLDLEIPAGSALALIGPAGSGKTRILQSMVGIRRPRAGSCAVLGLDPRRKGRAVRSRIGYVPQRFAVPAWMGAAEAGGVVGALQPSWDRGLFEGILALLEVPRERTVAEMAARDRETLALALALGHRPHAVLLDEPLACLDPAERLQTLGPVLGAARESGMTLLLASRMAHGLDAFADRVAVVRRGRLVEEAAAADLARRFHRAVLRYPGGLPASFQFDHALRFEVERDAVALVLEGRASFLRARLAALGPEAIEMQPLPLHEAVETILRRDERGEAGP